MDNAMPATRTCFPSARRPHRPNHHCRPFRTRLVGIPVRSPVVSRRMLCSADPQTVAAGSLHRIAQRRQQRNDRRRGSGRAPRRFPFRGLIEPPQRTQIGIGSGHREQAGRGLDGNVVLAHRYPARHLPQFQAIEQQRPKLRLGHRVTTDTLPQATPPPAKPPEGRPPATPPALRHPALDMPRATPAVPRHPTLGTRRPGESPPGDPRLLTGRFAVRSAAIGSPVRPADRHASRAPRHRRCLPARPRPRAAAKHRANPRWQASRASHGRFRMTNRGRPWTTDRRRSGTGARDPGDATPASAARCYSRGAENISLATLRCCHLPSLRLPLYTPFSTTTLPRSTVRLGHASILRPSHGE